MSGNYKKIQMIKIHQIGGNIVDPLRKKIYPGIIKIVDGRIESIRETNESYPYFIMPGFIDSHVHIESSMLTPYEFARMASVHGTVATVSDPHEIANVLGLEGVEYMLSNAAKTPFKVYFGAPSCVPATVFETAGATINVKDITYLFETYPDIKYLSEMMNFPGVLTRDPIVMKKINLAKQFKKQIDGHAPGLMGKQAKQYIEAGITTDHECFTLEEALDKLKYGMKIIIREGSAAKNFDALIPLLEKEEYVDKIMFCSDDKHPNDLVKGHINQLVKRALNRQIDLMKVLQCACVNPVKHYRLDVGLLQKGDPADFIMVDDLEKLNVLETYSNGQLLAQNGETVLDYNTDVHINNFNCSTIKKEQIRVEAKSKKYRVIEALEGQLVTNELTYPVKQKDGFAVSDVENDVLKILVVNRYSDAKPAIAFIKNFGLQRGAIASSVAHDSHNIIAVGVKDEDICEAVNLIIAEKGGLSVTCMEEDISAVLPLPLAGIMSTDNGYRIAQQYTRIDKLAKQLGTKLYAPYMTLSFMALLVIPQLKLSDKGLFDGKLFQFADLFLNG